MGKPDNLDNIIYCLNKIERMTKMIREEVVALREKEKSHNPITDAKESP